MTRDYAHRVVEAARVHGWAGSLPAPAPGAWPLPARSAEEINAIAGAPDYAYSSIWHSLTGIGGDFGRYILTPALDHIAVDDEQKLAREVERVVFERVLDLGWTPERFKDLDRGRHGGHDGVVERVGKKYQWIAFYEVLGCLTDHHLVQPRWGDDTPRVYEHAEQLIWRDIDPTVLVRKPPRQPPRGRHPWFAPVAAAFPDTVVNEYPSDMTGVPDPLDLLAVIDADGTDWLTLIGNHTWEQPLPVEVVAQRGPRLVTWMHLHAYLVPTTNVDGLTTWAQGQDWYGRWMPDTAEMHNVLLGAHPDGPGWEAADGAVERWATGRVPPPCELQQCALWYGGTGTDRDASAGNETVEEVAAETGANPGALRRLIRFLTSHDVFRLAGDRVEVTDLGRTLADGVPGSVRGLARYWSADALPAFQRPGAHRAHRRTRGHPLPRQADVRLGERIRASHPAAERRHERWPEGGTRRPLPALPAPAGRGRRRHRRRRRQHARRTPSHGPRAQRGPVRPAEVVAGAAAGLTEAGVADRVDVVAGNFFDAVPPADVHVMSVVLHDWDDESCLRILRNVAAAAPGAKLVLIETVVPEDGSPHFSKLLDLVMLAMLTGQERSETEWGTLLAKGGYTLDRIVTGSGAMSAIEATRA